MASRPQSQANGPFRTPYNPSTKLNPSLLKLKILDSLRTNSAAKLQAIVDEIDNSPTNFDLLKLKDELLIYAVQVGPFSMVKYIVENKLVDDLNVQDSDGNTALHLAAASNRSDVIAFLMAQPLINDCIVNIELQQPFQCTSDIATAKMMDQFRIKYVAAITSQLRHAFDNSDYKVLDTLLSSPRNKELLDINGTDPYNGDTVLLEFVKKNNVKMVEFILKHGADPFKRSSSGKSPEDLAHTPEMKAVLAESFTKQNIMDSTSKQKEGCPTFKGFLMKWTNFAGGYKLRWFVLDKEARLSYYKSPNDMNNTCRGMIHLAHAMVKVDSSENSKFEIIIQNPSDGTPVRWHLKSEHATETLKWVWVLQNAITYAKDQQRGRRKSSAVSHVKDEPQSSSVTSTTTSGSDSKVTSANFDVPVTIPETKALKSKDIEKDKESKNVAAILSEAESAAQDFKDLLNENESDVELPLKNPKPNVDDLKAIGELDSGSINDDRYTNNSIDRLSTSPAPNRNLSYMQPPSKARDSFDSQRSSASRQSNMSVGASTASDKSSLSKSAKAKKLYKKQLHKIPGFGKKKRESKLSYEQGNTSDVSFADSMASSVEYENEYTEEMDNDESSSDLSIIRNQINIQLTTFKDFLKHAAMDESLSKHELSDNCTGILNTLEGLIIKEGDVVNSKYNELAHRLDKQHKISNIWENSIKQLEFEIRDREEKIVALEDKLKGLKKSLRNSVLTGTGHLSINNTGSSVSDIKVSVPDKEPKPTTPISAAALARERLAANAKAFTTPPAPPVPVDQPKPPSLLVNSHRAFPPVPTGPAPPVPQNEEELSSDFLASELQGAQPALDPTLAQFLEEEDESDDEFFDAEEVDEIKDLAELEKYESNRNQETVKNETRNENELKGPIQNVTKSKMVLDDEQDGLDKTLDLNSNEVEKDDSSQIPILSTNNKTIGTESKTEVTKELDKQGHKGSEKEEELSSVDTEKEVHADEYVVNDHKLVANIQKDRYHTLMKEHTFNGYEDPLRTTLAPEDNRPKISLWGVLKSLVGKDMTKMTLPVSFNEPTSLLQRNVEVIEYSDLLDKASEIDSSTLRLVYVAAFAASEYASTVGRIAKPFNPLLGETFEYARPDKGYRCFVEQVSHHPPISALVAESASWSYYGESNVKTKFLGRSFDIKHLGTWFCELYPDHGVKTKDGSKTDMELYSWKKVNNSVIGIIVGNPTIDNYGEMHITNHMTGDYMKYTFKPRGWRASSAYEVKGEVFSADGTLRYYIGGHWNDKIYCKPSADNKSERFLIWQAKPRTEMMFHLTNFAATLNAPQPSLLPVVACTDTRLRPDQRAMENGEYDIAAEEKNRVEEKQREARKQREMKNETYSPEFFKRSKHPITHDEYWEYGSHYWKDRDEGKLKNYKDIF